MRNIKMTGSTKYPFSDLTHTDVERLKKAAHSERSEAIRSRLASIFRVRRQRQAQAWPSHNEPALSLKAYC
jgi:hypothetical protein